MQDVPSVHASLTMSMPQSLTATWVGEYRQHDHSYSITAELVEENELVTGSMRDGEPDHDVSVTEATATKAPGTDERIVGFLRSLFPEESASPVRFVSHLPETSRLQGWVRGGRVYFLKSYQGAHIGGYKVGDKMFSHQFDDHTVHYSGSLSSDQNEIEGQWSIGPSTANGGHRSEGSFTLRRHRDLPT